MNILVVDGSEEIRKAIAHNLHKLKHTVDLATDFDDAWAKINKNVYQVIMSDWKMPKLNILELSEKIKNHPLNRLSYFIVLTSISHKKHDLLDVMKSNVDDFLNKPVIADELEIRLRSATRMIELEASLENKNKKLVKINDQLETDLENATQTQLGVLPSFLDTKHIKSAWLYQPAVFVGGDTFNYYSPSPDFLVFFNLDVSGHGVSSAMLSMFLQSTLGLKRGLYGGAINRENISDMPEVFAKNLNDMLLDTATDHYITMIFGIMDFKTKEIHYVQAGHPHPLWFDNENKQLKEIDVNGFPVGLTSSATYETQHLSYKKGDKFIVYSDGMSEINSAKNNKQFTPKVLFDHFDQVKNDSPTEMIEEIQSSWLIEEQLDELPDDINILVFEFQ